MAALSTAEELLTYPQLAKRLKVQRTSLQAMVTARKIPAIRLSAKCVRFRWSEVEAALTRLTVKALA